MKNENLNSFHVIGIAIQTSNVNGKAGQDIPALWNRFLSEQTITKIPNKVNEDIYCAYTAYEGDHLQPYTTVLGCKVSSLDHIPPGMEGITIAKGTFRKSIAKGNLNEGVVWQEWTKIFNQNLDRSFATDFEIYDKKAQNPADAEVQIFVGLN